MAKKLKIGDVLRGHRVTKVFGPGMMAISYGATAPDGRKVFLKQYKSPAPSVVWYKAFVAYQRELGQRVGSGRAAHFAVQQLSAFEEIWGGPCYFQAFEFVENGADLQHMLDQEREQHRSTRRAPTDDPAVWARHVTWAKVLLAGIASLHDARVVHADLKPANAYLIEDRTIAAGFQLKLIDMDFSLLADRRAPWHGFQAYIGTDNYRSPEHLRRGAIPGPASDVFTAGLMLYELLAGFHPYWQDDQAEYARLAQAHAAKPPALLQRLPDGVSNEAVSQALHLCLSPDPSARPAAAALRALLSGRGGKPEGRPVSSAPSASAAKTTAAPAGRRLIAANELELVGAGGQALRLRVRTELGKALARQFGPEAEFWDERQCVLERDAAGRWTVAPIAGAVNETLLNGSALSAPHVLCEGDTIAVGRAAKGIAKLPLAVRGR